MSRDSKNLRRENTPCPTKLFSNVSTLVKCLMVLFRSFLFFFKKFSFIIKICWVNIMNKRAIMALNRSPESYVASKSAQIDLKKLDLVTKL